MGELFNAIKDRGLLSLPTPIAKTPNKRDRSRFCDFHNTNGHTTAQCRDLGNQVEDLVRNRYLDDFIEGPYPVDMSWKKMQKMLDANNQLSGL